MASAWPGSTRPRGPSSAGTPGIGCWSICCDRAAGGCGPCRSSGASGWSCCTGGWRCGARLGLGVRRSAPFPSRGPRRGGSAQDPTPRPGSAPDSEAPPQTPRSRPRLRGPAPGPLSDSAPTTPETRRPRPTLPDAPPQLCQRPRPHRGAPASPTLRAVSPPAAGGGLAPPRETH